MDKRFTVVVQTDGGEQRTLTVDGADSKSVFQRVKAMPGIRRVGKISEGTAAGASTGAGLAAIAAQTGPVHVSATPQAEREQKGDDRRASLGLTISGPRVVVSDRRVGVEQPFKHLQVTPEAIEAQRRVEEAQRQEEARRVAEAEARRIAAEEEARKLAEQRAIAEAAIVAATAAQAAARAEEEQSDNGSAEVKHRVVKSRRKTGEPYLLQRGQWVEASGKRTFRVDWEKGFPDAERAERHLQWMNETALEMEELAAADA